jgi:hypothetical protein
MLQNKFILIIAFLLLEKSTFSMFNNDENLSPKELGEKIGFYQIKEDVHREEASSDLQKSTLFGIGYYGLRIPCGAGYRKFTSIKNAFGITSLAFGSTIPFDKTEEKLANYKKIALLEKHKNKSDEFYAETLKYKHKYYDEHLNVYTFKRELTTAAIMPSKLPHVIPMTLFSCVLNNITNHETLSKENARNNANNIGNITDGLTLLNLMPKKII